MLTGIFTTFPTIQKGQDNEFELNVSVLQADVVANKDNYFNDLNVWSNVIVTYETSQGDQSEHIEFKIADPQPKGNFTISLEARDTWEIQAVTIVDKDGGSIVYHREELDTVYFDILLGAIAGLTWTTQTGVGTTFTTGPDSLNVTGNFQGWGFNARTVENFTGNCAIEFTLPSTFVSNKHIIVGFTDILTQDTTAPFLDSIGPCFYFVPEVSGYQIRHNSESPVANVTGLLPNDIIRIEIVGDIITFKKNGSTLESYDLNIWAGIVTTPRYLETVFLSTGALTGIKFEQL